MAATPTHRVIDFRVIGVLLLHLLVVLFLFPPLLVVQRLQVLPSVVFFHHFILFELIVSFFIVILQVVCGLVERKNKMDMEQISNLSYFVSTSKNKLGESGGGKLSLT